MPDLPKRRKRESNPHSYYAIAGFGPVKHTYASLRESPGRMPGMLLIILLILLVVFLFGGFGYNGGAYRNQGLGLVGVIIVILLILWLAGAFGGTANVG